MKAEEIKQLRSILGITQLELSKLIGVSLKTITNYETGGMIPLAKQKLLSEMLVNANNNTLNLGAVNSGSVGGHNVNIMGSDFQKIIDKDKIEVIGNDANKLYLQEITSLKAEIARLDAIVKSKDETIAAKDQLIEILRKK